MSEEVAVHNVYSLKPVYANNFAISMTTWDLSLHLTELVRADTTSGPKPSQELKALITMPLDMAEALSAALAHHLAEHKAKRHALQKAMGQGSPVN